MKTTTYARYRGEDWDELRIQELLNRLSDFLLQSGFDDPYFDDARGTDRDLQSLHDAILNALLRNDMLPEEMRRELSRISDGEELERSDVSRLVEYLIHRLVQEGYIHVQRGRAGGVGTRATGNDTAPVRFEVTDRALDFLGYKTLRNLLGSLGKSSFGRHDTRDLATGVEAGGATKPYEFGDTLNLDASGTILSSIRRAGLRIPLALEEDDLRIHQGEYQSSCATVLMLDCSHSMILYGEDRFTPAKKVALALAHLIRTEYPGDSLHVVLFHDSAEEIPIARLARVGSPV